MDNKKSSHVFKVGDRVRFPMPQTNSIPQQYEGYIAHILPSENCPDGRRYLINWDERKTGVRGSGYWKDYCASYQFEAVQE